MPSRRYQIPSFVRQTSSASTLPPPLNRITDLPLFASPTFGALVDTGPVLVEECAVAVFKDVDLVASTVGSGVAVSTITVADGEGEGAIKG